MWLAHRRFKWTSNATEGMVAFTTHPAPRGSGFSLHGVDRTGVEPAGEASKGLPAYLTPGPSPQPDRPAVTDRLPGYGSAPAAPRSTEVLAAGA